MIKPVEYLAGTLYMRTLPGKKNAALYYMQKNGVYFTDLRPDGDGAVFRVLNRRKKDKRLLSYAEITGGKGLIYDIKKLIKRPGVIIGALLFAFALRFSDSLLWDVRYESRGGENRENVMRVLSECGLKSGAFKALTDCESIENTVMLKCPDVSYVNVGIKGNVAYVTTDERVVFTPPAPTDKTDLFASEDGYIIRYETFSGVPVIEKGQTVKKGEMLFSGTYETHHNGTVTVRARGNAYALVRREILCETDETVSERSYTGKERINRAVTLFSHTFGINRFYDENNYEKTETTDSVTVFGAVRLPFYVKTGVYREYCTVERKLSREEAYRELDRMYETRFKELTEGAEVRETSVKRYYEDGRYKLRGEIWMVCNIAK